MGWGQEGPAKYGLSALASIFWVPPLAKEVRVKVSSFVPSSALLRTWLALCAESRPRWPPALSKHRQCFCPQNVPSSHPRSPAALGGAMRAHRAPSTVKTELLSHFSCREPRPSRNPCLVRGEGASRALSPAVGTGLREPCSALSCRDTAQHGWETLV